MQVRELNNRGCDETQSVHSSRNTVRRRKTQMEIDLMRRSRIKGTIVNGPDPSRARTTLHIWLDLELAPMPKSEDLRQWVTLPSRWITILPDVHAFPG